MHKHANAPTQFAEAKGLRYAYRRFGKPGALPLLMLRHFTGGRRDMERGEEFAASLRGVGIDPEAIARHLSTAETRRDLLTVTERILERKAEALPAIDVEGTFITGLAQLSAAFPPSVSWPRQDTPAARRLRTIFGFASGKLRPDPTLNLDLSPP